MTTPATASTHHRSRLGRVLIAAGVFPLAIAVAGAVAVWFWADELPARVAIHWGVDGVANGFASARATGWLVLGTGAVLAVLGGALGVVVRRESMLTRAIAGTVAGTAGFVTALVSASLDAQRGLADATEAGLSWWTIPAALLAAAVCAAIAVWLVPAWPDETGSGGVGDASPRVPVDAGERVVWTRSVATGATPVVVLVAGVGVTAAVAIVTGLWLVLVITVVVAVVAAMMFSIRVTVDRGGLTIRGAFGWPRLHTPLSEISRAGVATVRPLRDFGGFGYRIAAFGPLRGAAGFVMRAGDAIVVERTSGRRLLVVVDDAGTGAGLVNSLLDRQGQG